MIEEAEKYQEQDQEKKDTPGRTLPSPLLVRIMILSHGPPPS